MTPPARVLLAACLLGSLQEVSSSFVDTEPPVISLQLATHRRLPTPQPTAVPTVQPLHGAEGEKLRIIEEPHEVSSGASFADECCSGKQCGEASPCKLPVATAYDHHDGDLSESISTTFELFIDSAPGARPQQVGTPQTKDDMDRNIGASTDAPGTFRRGEFVIKYDVTDKTGNTAEQVVYALIMRDLVAPELMGDEEVISDYGDTTGFDPIDLNYFNDNYDGQYLSAKFQTNGGAETEVSRSAASDDMPSYSVNDKGVMTNGFACHDATVTATVTDYADIFGNGNVDNTATHTIRFRLLDDTPPVLDISQLTIENTECTHGNAHSAGTISGVTATDKSCNCKNGVTTLVLGSTGDKCEIECTDVFTPAMSGDQTVGNVAVTCTAKDWLDQTTAHTAPPFAVKDVTPPVLRLFSNGTNFLVGHHTGTYGEQVLNGHQMIITPTVENEATALIIEHAAGYLNDFREIQELQYFSSCEDACTQKDDLQEVTDWHKLLSPSVCGELTDHNDVIYLGDPGTFVLRYKCTDKAGNSAVRCRTILNEDVISNPLGATHAPTPAPTVERHVDFTLVFEPDEIAYIVVLQALTHNYLRFYSSSYFGEAKPNIIRYEFKADDNVDNTRRVVDVPGYTDYTATDYPIRLTGNQAVHESMEAYALSKGAQNKDLARSSPYKWKLDVRVVISDVDLTYDCFTQGIASWKNLVVPNPAQFCNPSPPTDDLASCLSLFESSERDITLFTSDKNQLVSAAQQYSDQCVDPAAFTTVHTEAPTPAPTSGDAPLINYVTQCNGVGPCAKHPVYPEKNNTDLQTCYCVAASPDAQYQDEGATCSDVLEGEMNANVRVSGDTVNLAVPGQYTLTYDCENSGGKAAPSLVRYVNVYDAVCPTCLDGAISDAAAFDSQSHITSETTTIEASFPYTDPGSTCVDNLDRADGTPTVLTPASVTGVVDVEATGTYVLTYSATDSSGNTNSHIGYNGATCNANINYKRTVVVVDTIKPVISLEDSMKTSLLEETSTAGGWSWAIACTCAVGGAALLAGRRRARRGQVSPATRLSPRKYGAF